MHKRSKQPKKAPITQEVDPPEETKEDIRRLAHILVDIFLDQEKLNERLVDNPEGYHLEERGRSCNLCQTPANGENSWYDNQGLKCMSCHQALAKQVIPDTVFDKPETYYTREQLLYTFQVPAPILKGWIKKRILTAREVLHYKTGRLHWQIFLLTDNPGFFPPHEMLRLGRFVPEEKEDGTSEYVFMPWQNFVDVKQYLKDYGIARYLV